MRKILLLAVVCLAFISSPTFGAIVYSGSQNVVTLRISPMNPMMSMMTINIAGQSNDWDDFTVELSWVDGMTSMVGMSHLVIYTPGSMMGIGMGGGIVRTVGTIHLASNLPPGTSIGPNSSFDYDWSLLYGSGNFGEGGYIGLMLERGTNPGTDLILPPYYGWLHMLGPNIGTDEHSFTFDRWAYNDQPGMLIGAGEVPIPGAVYLLGIGVLCLTSLRHRLKS
jgi:hypothetical protein